MKIMFNNLIQADLKVQSVVLGKKRKIKKNSNSVLETVFPSADFYSVMERYLSNKKIISDFVYMTHKLRKVSLEIYRHKQQFASQTE